jgi:predicted methyltransferase MtxX (methanogen marker protein 4)
MKVRRLHRAALLSTHQGKQFFLVPVGIDEGKSVSDRASLALKTSELLKSIDIDPAVGVLSGGRLEDKGRTRAVDLMLEHAEKLTRKLRAAGLQAVNYGILIEEAISTSNVLIAPDGISGNLIFRTLAFLGGGKGHGAPLLGIPYTFVDTSRSGAAFADAILIASALSFLAHRNTPAGQRFDDK